MLPPSQMNTAGFLALFISHILVCDLLDVCRLHVPYCPSVAQMVPEVSVIEPLRSKTNCIHLPQIWVDLGESCSFACK